MTEHWCDVIKLAVTRRHTSGSVHHNVELSSDLRVSVSSGFAFIALHRPVLYNVLQHYEKTHLLMR